MEEKRGGYLEGSGKGCIFAGRNKATIMEENQKKVIIDKGKEYF